MIKIGQKPAENDKNWSKPTENDKNFKFY